MIHPDIHVSWIDEHIGYGLFAHRFIPKGTITYVVDALEIAFDTNDPLVKDPTYGPIIERYSYRDAADRRIISWDIAKYMNHCCHANTLTTGYGFEIAIRDIEPGEEVKDDYGLFCDAHPMEIVCSLGSKCRKQIDYREFDRLVPVWDKKIEFAFQSFDIKNQPLWQFVDQKIQSQVLSYVNSKEGYRSVAEQRPSNAPKPAVMQRRSRMKSAQY